MTFNNYCHIKPAGHPVCDDLDMGEETIRRCGFEEDDARGYCGKSCSNSGECGVGEFCYPVQRNFCNCFEKQDEEASQSALRQATMTNAEYFSGAKEIIIPYFSEAPGATNPPTNFVWPVAAPTSACAAATPLRVMFGMLFAGAIFAF